MQFLKLESYYINDTVSFLKGLGMGWYGLVSSGSG
jgi:hypothetical protein